MTPPIQAGLTQVGALARLKLTEPVRLYLYSIGVLVVAGLVLAGWVTGDWQAYLVGALAVVLGLPVGTEAARATVYSPAGALIAAHQAATAARNAA